MSQKRNKLIELIMGNIANTIIHSILEISIKQDREELAAKYRKELVNSFEISKKYREKLNPSDRTLPMEEVDIIKIKNKVLSELNLRISKGYNNIQLNLIDQE